MESMDRFEDDHVIPAQQMTARSDRSAPHRSHVAASVAAPRAQGGQSAPRRVEWHGQHSPAVGRALAQLEREHLSMLLALCELESESGASASPVDTPAVRDALRVLLQEDVRRAQHALQRADDGLYGLCEQCHQPLPARQLAANPAATRCIGCETAATKVYH